MMRTCGSALVLSFLVAGCKPDADTVVTGIASTNPVVREDMVEFARKFDEPKVVGALIEALKDESATVRQTAIESLAELGHMAAIGPVSELMKKDPSPDVQRAAIDALGRLGSTDAVLPLIARLESSDPDSVELNVIWALGNIGDMKALEALSTLRSEATNIYVIYNTNVALREIK